MRLMVIGDKKSPRNSGAFCVVWAKFSDFSYVGCLQTFGALDHIEFNIIAFLEGFESFSSDSREMAKDIVTILLLEKTKPLCIIEPLYFSFCHFLLSPDSFDFTRWRHRTLFNRSNFTFNVKC